MKIRTVKEQYELRNICLRERLEQILPEVMRESEADLWLHASKEYHEDPTFRALTPADYPTARRVTMFAFVKDGDEVIRYSLSMPDAHLEEFYVPYWKFGQESQLDALKRLLEQYDPQKIAINASANFAFCDGLSMGIYTEWMKALDEKWLDRMISDDHLGIKLMERRTPTELQLLPEVVEAAFSVMNAMYTSEQVIPGKTTTEDLEWFMMQSVKDMGLDYWFEPTMDLQREGEVKERITGVIQRGDLLHCDFGIRYMNMCTDTQRLAYVAREGESEVPQDLQNGMRVNNRFQDIVREQMKPGRTGNEVLMASLAQAKEEGIEAVLYSHPCNMYGHGPGPTIGLWNQQSAIPIKGDIELDVNTVYALELNVKVPCKNKDYYIYTEETVLLDENGVHFLYEGRDQITLIR